MAYDDVCGPDLTLAMDAATRCGRVLAGLGPAVQGAALLQLVATWQAGFGGDPEVMERLFAAWIDGVRRLTASTRAEAAARRAREGR